MAPDDDEDSEDLYDDEFDFVDDDDDDDDDASDLDSEVDNDADDSADEDSDVDSELESVKSAPDSELDEAPAPRPVAAKRNDRATADSRDVNSRDIDARDRNPSDFDDTDRDGDRNLDGNADEEPADEFVAPATPANFLVHIYEYRQFKRTIDRPFTAEDAEAFASEYNRTSKSYGRFALAGKDDAKPKKALD